MAHNFDSNVSFGNDNPGFAGNFRALRFVASTGRFIARWLPRFVIFIYVFANVFFSSFIQQFLVILFLLSADFWTVKNVTGRLLVGLRWWNFVDAEGHNHWKFESSKDPTRFDPFERSIFWLALVTAPAFWVLLVCLAFVTFNWTWMVVALMGAAMTGANLYGYLRCRWSSTDEFTNYFTRWAFFSMLTRSNQAQQNPVPQGPLITA